MDEKWLADVEGDIRSHGPQQAYGRRRAQFEDAELSTGPGSRLALGLRGLSLIARALRLEGLASVLIGTAERPDDPRALHECGLELYEHGLMGVAEVVLRRAHSKAPDDPAIVSELAAVLEASMQNRAAADVIDGSGLAESDPLFAYLSGFNRLMTGDLDGAEERLRRVAPEFVPTRSVTPAGRVISSYPVLSGGEPPIRTMTQNLAGMVARARALREHDVTLDATALTAWHAVLNGSLLLHESDEGRDDGMNGRYAYVVDSPALLSRGARSLVRCLVHAEIEPTQVLRLPDDRMSALLAGVVARLIDRPVVDWQPGTSSGVVVAWQLTRQSPPELFDDVARHDDGLVLFVHASCWTRPTGLAPDVTTLLHQSIVSPYEGGALRLDEDGTVSEMGRDDRDTDALIAEVLASSPQPGDASVMDQVLSALSSLPEPYGLNVHRRSGPRLIERTGSPVPSARFL